MAENEFANLSLRVTVAEQAALKEAASKEKRSLANFLLVAGLERAKQKFGIDPHEKEEGSKLG